MKEQKKKIEKKSKPQPFFAPGYSAINAEEIKRRQISRKRAESIGASITKFTDEEKENPYRVQALVYISKGMEIPDELLEKMKKYDEENGIKVKTE